MKKESSDLKSVQVVYECISAYVIASDKNTESCVAFWLDGVATELTKTAEDCLLSSSGSEDEYYENAYKLRDIAIREKN